MNNLPAVQYSRAVISGWAIAPQLLFSSETRIDLAAVQLIDPLVEIPPAGNSLIPRDRWLEAAAALFRAPDGRPAVYDSVIGYSLGGILALTAIDAGLLVTRQLVLVSSTLCFVGEPSEDPESDLPKWPGAPLAALKSLRRTVTRERDDALRSFFSTVIGVTTPDRKRLEQLMQSSKTYSAEQLELGLDLLASIDLRPIAPAHNLPVMILHGTEDEVIPAAAAARGSHILPNTTPLFVNGGSHDLFHAAPDLLPSLLSGGQLV